jgi:hypothetical protein
LDEVVDMTDFEKEFGDVLHDTIIVETFSHRGPVGGAPVYNAPVTVKGRWVRRPRLTRRSDGSQLLSSSFVRIAVFTGLTPEGRVTLPDGSMSPIVSVETSPDENGNLYSMRVSFV